MKLLHAQKVVAKTILCAVSLAVGLLAAPVVRGANGDEATPPPAQEQPAIPEHGVVNPPEATEPVETNAVPPELQIPQPAAETSTVSPEAAQVTPPPVPAQPPVQIPTPAEPAPHSMPPAQPARAPEPPPQTPVAEVPSIDFEFQGAPVTAVLEWYARLTNRSIISAPNLAGVINFRSQTKLTKDEAIQALDSVLAINGVAALPLGEKFLKVVQIATAKQEGVLVGVSGDKALAPADSLLTQILPLKYAEAAEVVTALQPYLHAYGQLLPLTKSNSILITETSGNLNQMMEIVKYVDQPSALRMETKVYILVNAKAAEVVQQLQSIIQETQQIGARATAPSPVPTRRIVTPPGAAPVAGSGPSEESVVEGKVILTSDERTNKIFVLSRPANFAFFDQIIAELDAKVDPDVVMKVVELDYANSEDVASLLNSLITGSAPTATRRTQTQTGTTRAAVPPPPIPVATTAGGGDISGFLQFAQGVRILPDPRTNSLLLMATKEDMARIEELIHSIDTPVAQVLVEVVIAEVKLDGRLDVGVEAFKRQFQEGQVIQTGGTRTGQPSAPLDLSGLATNLGPLALSSGLTYFTTFNNLKLDAVIRLLSTSSKFKVLSTPIIQTLHNQEASIIVGESRPVVTSTVADVVSTASTAVRSSVEFKDIAIELKVTPRINPDGYVTMDIEQKINDVGGNVSVNGVDVPIITKREAKSSVSVKDQSTIVLGGLIREDKTLNETKVPFLGDIPLVGTLFKGKSTIKGRTELIVFIRPTVLRGDAAAVAEARRRSKMLKAGDELELGHKFYRSDEAKPADGGQSQMMTPAQSQTAEMIQPDNGRQAAKVKALKMQGVESAGQPY